jgi:CDP-glucose 4,6-dehydratase
LAKEKSSLEIVVKNLTNKKFWKKKKILITGHTGFKGTWLSLWLEKLSAEVHGISLPPPKNERNLFSLVNLKKNINSHFIDIRDKNILKKIIIKIKPEIIFHLAAQPLVKESYKNPLKTINTNIMGTVNLLEICREFKIAKTIIIITTDKVYENKEQKKPYDENSNLGGFDPYSSSKASVELISSSYRDSYFNNMGISIATARAGNVIGGGDWSANRIIPDAVKAWSKNKKLTIENPRSTRPWQHVLDSLYGYILLAQKINKNINLSGAYNFGPLNKRQYSVLDIVNIGKKYFDNSKISIKKKKTKYHQTKFLNLKTKKSKDILGFYPRWDTIKSIENTMNWYKKFYLGKNCKELCIKDIESYEDNKKK